MLLNMAAQQLDIFCLEGSHSVVFKIYPCDSPSGTLRDYIELTGGVLLDNDEQDPHQIVILNYEWYLNVEKQRLPTTLPSGNDYFKPKFLLDCRNANKIMNLNNYRCGDSFYHEYNAMDVLSRKLAWEELQTKIQTPITEKVHVAKRQSLTKSKSQEPKSPRRKLFDSPESAPPAKQSRKESNKAVETKITDGYSLPSHEEPCDPSSGTDSSRRKAFFVIDDLLQVLSTESDTSLEESGKSARSTQPAAGKELPRVQNNPLFKKKASYTYGEGQAILDYICENDLHHFVGGNNIWEDMAKKNVCRFRSGQSMKEHFRKKVLPTIGKNSMYSCAEKDVKKFKLAENERCRGRKLKYGR